MQNSEAWRIQYNTLPLKVQSSKFLERGTGEVDTFENVKSWAVLNWIVWDKKYNRQPTPGDIPPMIQIYFPARV